MKAKLNIEVTLLYVHSLQLELCLTGHLERSLTLLPENIFKLLSKEDNCILQFKHFLAIFPAESNLTKVVSKKKKKAARFSSALNFWVAQTERTFDSHGDQDRQNVLNFCSLWVCDAGRLKAHKQERKESIVLN